MAFKGEEKLITEVEAGSPIELPEIIKQRTGAKVGVLFGVDSYGSTVIPQVRYFAQNNTVQAPFVELPAQTQVRVLSGTTKGLIEAALIKSVADRSVPIAHYGVTTGTDPEVFVVHGDGKLFPAFEFLPEKSETTTEFWDGFQAEFRPNGGGCLVNLHSRIRHGLLAILQAARKHDKSARFSLRSVVEIPMELMEKATDAQVAFGCSPSENVYGEEDIVGSSNPRMYPYRTAGGHMHSSMKPTNKAETIRIVKACDGILGVAGVSLAAKFDVARRRTLYGRAGEFRLPKHGLEYRTLSNFWLAAPWVSMLAFELFRIAQRLGKSGMYAYYWKADEQRVRDIINNHDVTEARKLLNENKAALLYFMQERFDVYKAYSSYAHADKFAPAAAVAVLNGMESVIDNPEDIIGNWDLLKEGAYAKGWVTWCQQKSSEKFVLSATV